MEDLDLRAVAGTHDSMGSHPLDAPPTPTGAPMTDAKLADEIERCLVDGHWLRLTREEWQATIAALRRQPSDQVLMPRAPGTCELDDSPLLFAFLAELHSNVPDDKRPTGWSDFSDEQRERIK